MMNRSRAVMRGLAAVALLYSLACLAFVATLQAQSFGRYLQLWLGAITAFLPFVLPVFIGVFLWCALTAGQPTIQRDPSGSGVDLSDPIRNRISARGEITNNNFDPNGSPFGLERGLGE